MAKKAVIVPEPAPPPFTLPDLAAIHLMPTPELHVLAEWLNAMWAVGEYKNAVWATLYDRLDAAARNVNRMVAEDGGPRP